MAPAVGSMAAEPSGSDIAARRPDVVQEAAEGRSLEQSKTPPALEVLVPNWKARLEAPGTIDRRWDPSWHRAVQGTVQCC